MKKVSQSFLILGVRMLTRGEVNQILSHSYFFENNLYKVVEHNGCINALYSEEDQFSESMRLKEAYESGKSILVKGMENWNEAIRCHVDTLGGDCDVHLFISPENGSAIPLHQDERDVVIRMIYGHKRFTNDGVVYPLFPGNTLLLDSKLKHKAKAMTPCAHLSFGIRPKTPTSLDDKYLTIDGIKIV
jgi:ribosomal protein L16 Arg81 hydroxylase